MNQTKIERVSKQEEIRSAITEYIVSNSLPTGALMPTETKLGMELGVGRNALREAMKVLQALGIVEIRHGFGTYVGNAALTALESGLKFRTEKSLRSDLSEIRNLLDVREVLEVGLAHRVVNTLSSNDLKILNNIVRGMEEEASSGKYFRTLDWRFHEALYLPLGNELIVDLLRVFWRVYNDIETELPGVKYSPETAARWHRDIFAAIAARDVKLTEKALATHFTDIRVRVGSN